MVLDTLLSRRPSGPPPGLVTVLRRAGRLYVQASDRTVMRTAGFWVAAGPVAALTEPIEPARLGAAILEALARSRVEVPVPPRGADLEAPLRQAAGVRSRRALMAGARACLVAREADGLQVDPVPDGSTEGERGDERATRRLPAEAGPDAIGRAVLETLAP